MHCHCSLIIRSVVFLSLVFLALATGRSDEFRHWTTKNGVRSDVPLMLVEKTSVAVKLKREDNGNMITLPLSQLSSSDRLYLNQVDEKQSATEASTTTDWPQWRGPDRDGKSHATGLLTQWPEGGPELLWIAEGLGEGYSTPSVTNGKIYVLGTRGAEEAVFALNANKGEKVWEAGLGRLSEGGGYPGPRGAATVDGNFVYAIGGEGTLICLKVGDGAPLWSKNLQSDFDGKPGHWRYAESPLIDGNKLICTPGGSRNTVVALNKLDGRPMWQSVVPLQEGVDAAYASPIATEILKTRQYVVFLSGGLVGIEANTGTPLWSYTSPANGTANCSTPVAMDNSVFAASGYGTGGGRVTIFRRGNAWMANEDYFVRKFENHHGGFVLHEGYLYGTNDSLLLCVDWKTGQIMWQDRCVGKGSTSFADGHLYVRSEGDDVALVEATPEAYREKGRFSQPHRSDKQAWPHPVIAGEHLYLHDQDRLLCFSLKSTN